MLADRVVVSRISDVLLAQQRGYVHVVGRVKTKTYDVIYKESKVHHLLKLCLDDGSGSTLQVELWGQPVCDVLCHQVCIGRVMLITNLARKVDAGVRGKGNRGLDDESAFVSGFNKANASATARGGDTPPVFRQPWSQPAHSATPILATVFSCDASVEPRVVYCGEEQVQSPLAALYDTLAQPEAPRPVSRADSFQAALCLAKGSVFGMNLHVAVAAAADEVLVTDCPAGDEALDGAPPAPAVRLVFQTRRARLDFHTRHAEYASHAGATPHVVAFCSCLSILRTRRNCEAITALLYSDRSSVAFGPSASAASLSSSSSSSSSSDAAGIDSIEDVPFARLCASLGPDHADSPELPNLRGRKVRTACCLGAVHFSRAESSVAEPDLVAALVEVHRGAGPGGEVDCWYRPALLTLTLAADSAGGLRTLRALAHDLVVQRLLGNVPAGVFLAASLYPGLFRGGAPGGLPGDLAYLTDVVARCAAGLGQSALEGAALQCVLRAPERDAATDDGAEPRDRGYDVVLLDISFVL